MATPIKFPSQQDWAKQFGAGIKAAQGAALSAELHGVTSVLGAVFESEAGQQLGKAVAEAGAKAAASVVSGLLKGTLKLAPELVVELGKAAAQFGTMVPMFAAAWEMGNDILDAHHAQRRDQLQGYTQAAVDACRARVLQPKGTGLGGAITPADTMRPVFEALQQGEPLHRAPLCVGSLICALCGDESPFGWRAQYVTKVQGLEGKNETANAKTSITMIHDKGAKGYAQWVTLQRKFWNDDRIGIPLATRKRMATIIRGILSAVRPYTKDKVDPVGDQGRALWPVLLDILLTEWRAGHWNEGGLNYLQQSQLGCWTVLDRVTAGNVGPVVSLAPEMVALVMSWKSTIEDASAMSGPEKASSYTRFTAHAAAVNPVPPRVALKIAKKALRGGKNLDLAPGELSVAPEKILVGVAAVAALAAMTRR